MCCNWVQVFLYPHLWFVTVISMVICCLVTGSIILLKFISVQSLSRVRLFATPWTAALQTFLSITNSQTLLKLNVHRVSDAIQPSHPLWFPSLPAFSLSQHQGLFKWVSSVEFQLQLQSFLPMNIQDWFPLGLTGLISLQSKGLSRVFSPTNLSLFPSPRAYVQPLFNSLKARSLLK